ncbi:hypothetical protein [Streptomyces albogriseolus]
MAAALGVFCGGAVELRVGVLHTLSKVYMLVGSGGASMRCQELHNG